MPCFVVQLIGIFSCFSERYLVLPSGNLQIHAARRHDQGEYRCVVTNSVSGERRASPRSVRLQVTREYKSTATQLQLNIHEHVGSTLCNSGTHPHHQSPAQSYISSSTTAVLPLAVGRRFSQFRELISYCVTHDSAKSEMTSLKCQLDNHDTVLIFFHENRKKVAG